MKEMIKKYKGTLICSVLVMLAGILVGFTMAQSIWINVFFVVTDCILVTIIFYDNRNRQQSSKVIGMVIWMIPVTALIYNGMARLISMDADSENLFMAVIYFGTGLLFMIIGNYLPKVKQNNTIGIRVVWTLQDEENWSATHRFSGKLWVASGVLCMLCGLFGESIAALVLYIVSIMAAAIVSILYSYLFYKKKMAAGEKLKIQYNKKTIVIYVIVSVFVVIFTIWTLFWGGIDISFHDNDFTVEAQGWSDYTVDYEQIDSISYKENLFQNGNDRRTNGMGNLKYGMGNFRNDIYGDYIRYTHASCHSYVVMDIGGKILVVNGVDESETKKIYDTLREKYVIVSVFVVIFTIWTLFWGGIDISFHDNDFTVEAQGWSDYTVDYEQIDSISYKENLFQNGNDRRTNGMGNLKYGMGNFRNDIYGDYIRYTHASCHSYVVMDIGGKILVVNGADNSETKKIYDTLREKCQMN